MCNRLRHTRNNRGLNMCSKDFPNILHHHTRNNLRPMRSTFNILRTHHCISTPTRTLRSGRSTRLPRCITAMLLSLPKRKLRRARHFARPRV
jgi:hypothetical protein